MNLTTLQINLRSTASFNFSNVSPPSLTFSENVICDLQGITCLIKPEDRRVLVQSSNNLSIDLRLKVPSIVSVCRDLQLDASATSTVGYFTLEFAWNITRGCIPRSSTPTNDSFENWTLPYSSFNKSNSIIQIPHNFHSASCFYNISLQARVLGYIFGTNASTSVKEANAIMVSTPLGSSVRIKRDQQLVVPLNLITEPCTGT